MLEQTAAVHFEWGFKGSLLTCTRHEKSGGLASEEGVGGGRFPSKLSTARKHCTHSTVRSKTVRSLKSPPLGGRAIMPPSICSISAGLGPRQGLVRRPLTTLTRCCCLPCRHLLARVWWGERRLQWARVRGLHVLPDERPWPTPTAQGRRARVRDWSLCAWGDPPVCWPPGCVFLGEARSTRRHREASLVSACVYMHIHGDQVHLWTIFMNYLHGPSSWTIIMDHHHGLSSWTIFMDLPWMHAHPWRQCASI